MVEEKRKYPILGYAPGSYVCYCVDCKDEFSGDKRAVQCETCATDKSYDILIKQNQELTNTLKIQSTEINDKAKEIEDGIRINKIIGEQNRNVNEMYVELETLCSEAMGEQTQEWKDRFKKVLKRKELLQK